MHSSESFSSTEQETAIGQNSWDTLKEVDYLGDTITGRDNGLSAEKAANRLRELMDWKAKAKLKDPEGLAEAISIDERENLKRHQAKQKIYDGVKRYKELQAGSEALLRRLGELLELQHTRVRDFGYRVKQKLGLRDSRMEKWNDELSQIEDQRQELIHLGGSGYGGDEGAIQARINAIGDDTHDKEFAFVNSFVTPLEKEQKKELLNFDVLAELSTREYLDLWKGLNPYFLSHVTRQGYRDHTGMIYHTAGLNEFQDNFKNIIGSDKKLHSVWESATGRGMSEVGDEVSVDRYIQSDPYLQDELGRIPQGEDLSENNLAAALGGGHNILSQPDGYWRDKTSVHFMGNAVGDEYYGAEEGNEIFFVFPTDVLASQCYSNQNLGDTDNYDYQKTRGLAPHKAANEHNDYYIMPRENGIPLDAGLVFLPKNTLVNPKNGSKYQTYDTENSVLASVENNGVRAERYWEQYFTEHPETKPAHIIYYDGSPENAVRDLLQTEGIVVGGAGDLNDGSDSYDCGWEENVTYGNTVAKQQVNQERKTFFEKIAQYVKEQDQS